MEILTYNFFWMMLNLFLAAIPLISGTIFLRAKNMVFRLLFFCIFLIFIPNTLYIITDLLHIPEQINEVGSVEKIILVLQYLILEVLGSLSFILSVNIFEKIISLFTTRKSTIRFSIIILNFIIGFGVVLGRILRLNSWEIFINVEKVISNSFFVLSSAQLIFMAIFFGIIGNVMYFSFRSYIINFLTKLYHSFKNNL